MMPSIAHIDHLTLINDSMYSLSNNVKFCEKVLDPNSWLEIGKYLFASAELLSPKVDEFWKKRRNGFSDSTIREWEDHFVAIYFMLCAYAIENLLKFHIVRKYRADIEKQLLSQKTLPKILIGHDLYKLARKAGFDAMAREEEPLFLRLRRSAVWYGRYPVPLSATQLKQMQSSENYDFPISLTGYSSADQNSIRRIVNELSGRFHSV